MGCWEGEEGVGLRGWRGCECVRHGESLRLRFDVSGGCVMRVGGYRQILRLLVERDVD